MARTPVPSEIRDGRKVPLSNCTLVSPNLLKPKPVSARMPTAAWAHIPRFSEARLANANEPRLSANNLSSGEVGVSANHRSPRQPARAGVLDRKIGVL